VSIFGMRLTATMAVLRLADGALLLYSPISRAADPRRWQRVVRPGTVARRKTDGIERSDRRLA
jgi:hypothetical protein